MINDNPKTVWSPFIQGNGPKAYLYAEVGIMYAHDRQGYTYLNPTTNELNDKQPANWEETG